VRVLAACSLGGAGHLRPLAPFLDQVRRGGGETLVVGPPALAGLVRATGHPFLAGGEPAEEQVRPIREQLAVLPPREAAVLGNRELFGRLAATAMLAPMEQAAADWRPDVILRDPCEYASAVAAARLGIPAAQVAIGLAGVEWDSVGVAEPALEALRDGLADELRRSPYLTRFPAALDASPFPGTRRYREAAATPRDPLPDWWPGSTGPLVYVSFGTVLGHMSLAAEVYRLAIDAVSGLGARVLLTTGHAFEASRLGEVPGNVHVEAWVDQADVLGEAALVVCHGGSGTTFGALAAGVPLVMVPVFADQFANAPLVARAGAGIEVSAPQISAGQGPPGRRGPVSRDDAPRIRAAVETVLADGSYQEAARAVAAQMAAAPEIGTLLGQLPLRH
jgi:UDP:flavonoid glycosyltransferase YjiC (YdhE family)